MNKQLTTITSNQAIFMPVNTDKDTRYRLQIYVDWLDNFKHNWSEPDLDAYAFYLQNTYSGKRGKPMSATTAKVHLSVIRSRYQKLLRNNEIRDMLYALAPANSKAADKYAFVSEALTRLANAVHPDNGKVAVVKKQDQLDTDHLRLTNDQTKDLLSQPGIKSKLAIRDTAILALMMCTGLRENELVNLDVSDIRQKSDNQLGLWVKSGKGAKARFIPYGSYSWCLMFVDLWLKTSGITEGALFRGMRKGDKVTTNRIHVRAINQILDRYKIVIDGKETKVDPHDLRRTYALRMYLDGMDILAIRDNLGHEDVKTTQGYIGEMNMDKRTPKQGLQIDLTAVRELLKSLD